MKGQYADLEHPALTHPLSLCFQIPIRTNEHIDYHDSPRTTSIFLPFVNAILSSGPSSLQRSINGRPVVVRRRRSST